MNESYLSAQALSVGYQGRALMDNVNLEVRRGEILTLIGPNGAGKSTILRSLIHQLKLIAGTVVLDGASLQSLSEKALAKKMAVLMTERIRPELMTCWDVVSTGRYPYTGSLGILSEEDKKIVRSAMEAVHAEDLANRSFDRISDGQRQRILLARAICQEPEIIVLDEPTSFLDVRHKLELLTILKDMVKERNVAVIMSLHELDLAQRISDKIVCVSSRGIECQGSPEEIFAGDRVAKLYEISKGSFFPEYGSVELARPEGAPRVFVIGGGGAGIGVYRHLQRKGIPFAVGVLPENDVDYPVAKALASALISVPVFSTVSEEDVENARAVMEKCEYVISAALFGPGNAACKALISLAGDKLTTIDTM